MKKNPISMRRTPIIGWGQSFIFWCANPPNKNLSFRRPLKPAEDCGGLPAKFRAEQPQARNCGQSITPTPKLLHPLTPPSSSEPRRVSLNHTSSSSLSALLANRENTSGRPSLEEKKRNSKNGFEPNPFLATPGPKKKRGKKNRLAGQTSPQPPLSPVQKKDCIQKEGGNENEIKKACGLAVGLDGEFGSHPPNAKRRPVGVQGHSVGGTELRPQAGPVGPRPAPHPHDHLY